MLSLSLKIHGYIKMYRHPTTTHTSYECNALGWYTMEYPKCHLHFLCIHTIIKLIVHIWKENTCTCDLWVISCYSNNNNNNNNNLFVITHAVIGQFCRPYSMARPAKLESSLSCGQVK